MKNLIIISNEKIYQEGKNFFCDNIDLKSTPEGLSKNFNICIIARSTKKNKAFKIDNKSFPIDIFSNIFSFLSKIKKIEKNNKILLISISPYTFLASVILSLSRKEHFVYLRSDGFKEYKAILGFLGPFIYGIMFFIIWKFSNLISCNERILRNKKGKIVFPSQLSNIWFSSQKEIEPTKPKLLYVGRLRKEKGIFSLIKILKKDNTLNLNIVGSDDLAPSTEFLKNISFNPIEKNEKNLIKIYDEHNIFILPSFTEGHPMVVLESLARLRPVIIFEEISHVATNKTGVFICKRDLYSLKDKINYIMQNYINIQDQIKKNILPSKEKFISDLTNILK